MKMSWNHHYTKPKSQLSYPDENLVRLLNKNQFTGNRALDLGAGSGRHSILLKNFGFQVTATDSAENSINQIKTLYPELDAIQTIDSKLPFPDSSFDLVVSWGVLHYNSIDEIHKILAEIKRILTIGGIFFGTIRANTDTHLKLESTNIHLDDLKGVHARVFSLEEIQELLVNFTETKFGYMERTPIGNLEERICHWIFQAKKL
ncbi:MAG: class I SAM-dependent methyltransferase [Leptospiraceae bacterium]|nr:class I SAM-dependent methyltransferase [Leptospiraceae bacterium]